jgi:hypothetical protein
MAACRQGGIGHTPYSLVAHEGVVLLPEAPDYPTSENLCLPRTTVNKAMKKGPGA